MEDFTCEQDVVEFSLDVAEVGPIADICCKCTGACKTTRCICRKNGHGCTLGKCKCKPSKCSQLKEQAAVDIAALGTFIGQTLSQRMFVFVLMLVTPAIKQKECESQSKCNPSVCENKVLSSLTSSSTPSSAPSTITAKKNIEQEVKEFCATHSKSEMEGISRRNASVSGITLSSAMEEHCDKSGFSSFLSFEGRATMVQVWKVPRGVRFVGQNML